MKLLIVALTLVLAAPADAVTLYHEAGTVKNNVGHRCAEEDAHGIWVAAPHVPCGSRVFLSVAHDPNNTAGIESVRVVATSRGLVISRNLGSTLGVSKTAQFHYYEVP
jgi:hypothetical protein